MGKTLLAVKVDETTRRGSERPCVGFGWKTGELYTLETRPDILPGARRWWTRSLKGKELEAYLERQGRIEAVVWKGGVYDRLMNGQAETQGCEPLKNCRIWQLKPDVNIHMKFIGYDTLVTRFGEPDPQNYHMVYDGEIETNELERIYDKFDDGQEVPVIRALPLGVRCD